MSHPLLCWDIFSEGLQRRMDVAEDINMLQKITIGRGWHDIPVSAVNALVWEDKVIVITDNKLTITYATKNISSMNGYKQDEVIGKSPKIFQGNQTEAAEKKLVRSAINSRKPFETLITNYKKDGSIYKCYIEGYPVFNKEGNMVNFIALEIAT